MIIYKITNKVNGKVYVGQTRFTLAKRWYEHCREESDCRALKSAIVKYGKESFSKEIIGTYTNSEDLNNAESYFIDYYQSLGTGGYNLTTGGDGRTVSDETRHLQSIALLGRSRYFKNPEEAKRRMSAAKKGKSPWNKGLKNSQKPTCYWTGKKMSPETRAKMRASRLRNLGRAA